MKRKIVKIRKRLLETLKDSLCHRGFSPYRVCGVALGD